MNKDRAPVATTKPVSQLLFDGYSDDLLTIIRANGNPDLPKVSAKLYTFCIDSEF